MRYPVTIHPNGLPSRLVTAMLQNDATLAMDIETSGLAWQTERIACVTIGRENGEVHIVRHSDGELDSGIVALLEDAATSKLWHYGIFDLRFLIRDSPWIVPQGTHYDTKILATMLNEPNKGLKPLLEKYLGVPQEKSQATSNWFAEEWTTEQIDYAARDVAHLRQLHELMERELDDDQLNRYFHYASALVGRALAEVVDDMPDIWAQR